MGRIIKNSQLTSSAELLDVYSVKIRIVIQVNNNILALQSKTGQTVQYDCAVSMTMEKLTRYIPNFMFVDSKDIIPGIYNKKIPNLAPKDMSIKESQSEIVYIKNVEIYLAKNYEQNIINFATRYRNSTVGNIKA